MKLDDLEITNYKALKAIKVQLSKFVCLIGENNAGKSSVLQALKLLIDGGTLSTSHFYDPGIPIRIQLTLKDISSADLKRLVPAHQGKLTAMVRNGILVLVRTFQPDKRSTLQYVQRVPKDSRFNETELSELLSGKVSDKMREALEERFPELMGKTKDISKIVELRAAVDGLAAGLSDDLTEPRDKALDTGIDASVLALLPEPIYIPAVKDLADDVKTATGTPFGKILKVLLDVIAPKLTTQQVLFDGLNAKLNRIQRPDGVIIDEDRLPEVRLIESTVEQFVQESFAEVQLRINIPPPKLQTILSGAEIIINDGVEGLIDTKGDGLKRAVVFSILRSYVELNRPGKLLPALGTATDTQTTTNPEPSQVAVGSVQQGAVAMPQPTSTEDDVGSSLPRPYLLLFEEPELYLYPKAQQILFEALSLFSKTHPVLVTTHSPSFFGPDGTTTFVKMRKVKPSTGGQKPYAKETLIDVSGGDEREQFQLVCYENNNIAFFADRVVLVEGDSDYIVVPHIANLLRPGWATGKTPVQFAKIGGKSNVVRYRAFFERFGMTVYVLTDLDFLLGGEFTKVVSSESLRQQRNNLIAAIDAYIIKSGGFEEPKAKHVKEAIGKADIQVLWKHARVAKARYDAGKAKLDEVVDAINSCFSWEKYLPRLDVLEQSPSGEIHTMLVALLASLRNERIFVLERGAIEDYYPQGVTGEGKPAKAINCCEKIKTAEDARALCATDHCDINGKTVPEFDAIFSHLIDH